MPRTTSEDNRDYRNDAVDDREDIEDIADREDSDIPRRHARRRSAKWEEPLPRRPRKTVRMKAHWGVYSESLKEVALYDYSKREEAERRAAELSQSKRVPHFVQMVKKEIKDE